MTVVLGVTGGIASGKSTVDNFFHQKDIPVIDSDVISHEILTPGNVGYAAVVSQFGPSYLNPDKTINRRKLGELVFNEPRQLQILNKITHPLIFQEIENRITQNKQAGKQLVVVDVPLLFESGDQSYYDSILLIAVPEDLQIKRLRQRDHLNRAESLRRIHSQMPLVEKEKLADYVITNTGTIKELESKLNRLLLKIKEENQHGMS